MDEEAWGSEATKIYHSLPVRSAIELSGIREQRNGATGVSYTIVSNTRNMDCGDSWVHRPWIGQKITEALNGIYLACTPILQGCDSKYHCQILYKMYESVMASSASPRNTLCEIPGFLPRCIKWTNLTLQSEHFRRPYSMTVNQLDDFVERVICASQDPKVLHIILDLEMNLSFDSWLVVGFPRDFDEVHRNLGVTTDDHKPKEILHDKN